jgi:polyisoprenoid-binding protein YceI
MGRRPVRPRIATALLVLGLLSAAAPARAARRLALDPAGTRVLFELDAGLHTVRGTARMTQGEIVFDPDAGSATGRIHVDARSLQSGNGSRDRTMHSDVLESARFPDIVLIPDRLEGDLPAEGEGDVTLSGTLEIHGAGHPVRVPARVRVAAGRLTGTARFTIPYVAWGMKDPSVFILRVKKEVAITLELSGLLTPAP